MPKVSRKASKKVKRAAMADVMHRHKHGQLHSGSKSGPVVQSRKQAIAIGLSESGQSRRKVGKRGKRKGARRKR